MFTVLGPHRLGKAIAFGGIKATQRCGHPQGGEAATACGNARATDATAITGDEYRFDIGGAKFIGAWLEAMLSFIPIMAAAQGRSHMGIRDHALMQQQPGGDRLAPLPADPPADAYELRIADGLDGLDPFHMADTGQAQPCEVAHALGQIAPAAQRAGGVAEQGGQVRVTCRIEDARDAPTGRDHFGRVVKHQGSAAGDPDTLIRKHADRLVQDLCSADSHHAGDGPARNGHRTLHGAHGDEHPAPFDQLARFAISDEDAAVGLHLPNLT